ncbi:MAG TPA: chloride channel protein [Candidatus Acidoferrales bacterium]|nr:chloride channel protein [Candidatus Acidoferrales bacterium]
MKFFDRMDEPAERGSASVRFRVGYISLLASVVGIIAGCSAFVLFKLIAFITNIAFFSVWSFQFRSAAENQRGVWVILIPVIGGLLIGLMAKYGSPKIRGHGIPEAMEAVLVSRSRIPAKVAILKPISAAIGIGSGGPFGAEGPIIQTGGALGSLVGQMVSTTAAERKVLLACGAGAGLAAMFNAPITGALLAIELLLFEFQARSFIPLMLASALAVAVRLRFFGDETMFQVGAFDYDLIHGIPFYLILGLICGFAAIGFSSTLKRLEDFFDHMKKPPAVFHPAIGALGLGITGYFFPRVFGPGYATIRDVLNVRMALTAVVLLLIFKAFVVLLSLGSGTSGGTLAPMFMMSAAIGSTFAMIVNYVIPGAHLSVGAYAVAAMGALLCACARAPFTFLICAIETTHDFHAVAPIILVCIVAVAVAVRFMPHSIMTEKLERMGFGAGQDYESNSLKQLRVADVMVRDVATVQPEETVCSAADRFAGGDLKNSRHHALPIVNAAGRLLGLVTQGDLLRALQSDPEGKIKVIDAGATSLVVAHPDERVFDAVKKMLENNIGRLPVVDRTDPQKMVGYINRANVMGSWRGQLHAESVREHGWLRNLRSVSGFRSNGGVSVGRVQALTDEQLLLLIPNNDEDEHEDAFVLNGPVRGVFLGDEVRVSYQRNNGKKVALRIEELSSRQ